MDTVHNPAAKIAGRGTKVTDRLDGLSHIPREFRHTKVPPPISVKIELTGGCNFKCTFCAFSKNLRAKGHMDRSLYERVVTELHAIGVREVGFFYLGESFLVPWLPEAIRLATELGFENRFLTTNGSLATPERVRACMEAGLSSLKWSLNYDSPEQLVEIARVDARNFDLLMTHIEKAFRVREEGGFDCGLTASYIRYDGEQGERMKAVIERVQPFVDHVYGLPLYSHAGDVGDEE